MQLVSSKALSRVGLGGGKGVNFKNIPTTNLA